MKCFPSIIGAVSGSIKVDILKPQDWISKAEYNEMGHDVLKQKYINFCF